MVLRNQVLENSSPKRREDSEHSLIGEREKESKVRRDHRNYDKSSKNRKSDHSSSEDIRKRHQNDRSHSPRNDARSRNNIISDKRDENRKRRQNKTDDKRNRNSSSESPQRSQISSNAYSKGTSDKSISKLIPLREVTHLVLRDKE